MLGRLVQNRRNRQVSSQPFRGERKKRQACIPVRSGVLSKFCGAQRGSWDALDLPGRFCPCRYPGGTDGYERTARFVIVAVIVVRFGFRGL